MSDETKRNDGGQAFPRQGQQMPNGEQLWPENGMSLLAYFAGQALVGVLGATGWRIDGKDVRSPAEYSRLAFNIAGAMLAELDRR